MTPGQPDHPTGPDHKGDPLALPFDQYQRYRLVADLLGQLRESEPRKVPLEVLDVGGRTALLRRFLLRDKITLVDMEPSEEKGLVLGDGGRLPFQDDAFDVVTAFDTLEHVPPKHREAFVSECHRVARKWVVLAGPYHTERVAEAEDVLKRFLLDKLGVEHRYLNEHRTHGLPDRAEVEARLRDLGASVTSIGHANLDRWLVLMCATMYMDEDPALRDLARAFSRFYNASLYASDHAEPVYRHLVVAATGGAALPSASEVLDLPVAPQGALAGFAEFTTELLAFDLERDEWRAERARLRKVAADLEEDLAGHRASLSEARAEAESLEQVRTELGSDLGQLGQVVGTLEADLAGHKESLAEARAELEARAEALSDMQRELERERRAGKESLAEARTELEARAEGLSDMQRELERERRVGEDSRQVLARDLSSHKQSIAAQAEELKAVQGVYERLVADTGREREEQRAVQSALEEQLAEHRRVLEELRAERAAVETERERQRAEGELVRAELARDLDGHRAVVEELRGILAEKEAGLAQLEAQARGLEEQLAATGERAATQAAELEIQRARLLDRWGSLKRALGPRQRED